MNTGRVILAGLAAGVVMNVIGFVVNGVILAHQWTDATKALLIDVEKVAAQSTVGWVLMGLLIGLVIAWLYAAIRPRFGAGPGTGLRAGFAAWLIMDAALAAGFNGVYPPSLIFHATLGGLASTLAAGWVAGALYREA